MATALTTLAPPAAEPAAAMPRAWWRRGHTYATAGVAVAELAVVWLAMWAVSKIGGSGFWEEMGSAALIGLLIAKCFLLGLWAGLGSPSTVPRWLLVGGLAAAGSTVIALRFFDDNPGSTENLMLLLQIVLFAWVLVAGYAALLLPLRRLAGWRVEYDAAHFPRTGQRRGQMGLMDFTGMTCAIALPLTLGRILAATDESGDAAESLGSLALVGGLVLITAAPAAFAALARRAWLWLPALAFWLLVAGGGHSLLATRYPDLDLFEGSNSLWGLEWTTLALHAGAALAVILPLGLLRLCGLKILTVA